VIVWLGNYSLGGDDETVTDDHDWADLPEPHIYGPLRSINLNDLDVLLEESARREAQLALREFTDELYGQIVAALHAGMAVEHLAKRYLVSIGPVLIAENDLDSVLMLSGNGELARLRAHQIKTISATEACKRVKRLHPEFPYQSPRDDAIFVVRNAAAHLGVTDTFPMGQAVRLMVRLIDSLLEALEADADRLWGDSLPAVIALRDEVANEIKAIVIGKYTATTSRLAERVAGLDSSQRELVLRAVSGQHYWEMERSHAFTCPVCSQQGWLECSQEYVGAFESSLDAAGNPITLAETVLYPQIFYCSACGLQLEGDELGEADVPDSINIGVTEVDEATLESMNEVPEAE
jgi:hypothetical protein